MSVNYYLRYHTTKRKEMRNDGDINNYTSIIDSLAMCFYERYDRVRQTYCRNREKD